MERTAHTLTRKSVHDKLTGYLFNPTNKDGWLKGQWFIRALGFNPEIQQHVRLLEEQVVFRKSVARFSKVTRWGIRYNQDLAILGPNGKTIEGVRTVWQANRHTGIVTLMTIMPPK